MKPLLAVILLLGMALPLVAPVPVPGQAPPAPATAGPGWREAAPPAGSNAPDAQWIEVDAPGGKTITAASFRPAEDGVFPAVVVLHGTGGWRTLHLDYARELSQAGFVAVTACWFGGHYTLGVPLVLTTFPNAVYCPAGPDIKPTNSPAVVDDIKALLAAVRTLPGVAPDRIGLWGHSRGSIASLLTASMGGDVQAVVAVGSYPALSSVAALQAPALILHGTADQTTLVEDARAYEEALRQANKPYEAYYYEGEVHNFPFLPASRADSIQRSSLFFAQYLYR